ncbi:MAG: hypothetical protein U0174_16175 [Polyangiaceae bacterium]
MRLAVPLLVFFAPLSALAMPQAEGETPPPAAATAAPVAPANGPTTPAPVAPPLAPVTPAAAPVAAPVAPAPVPSTPTGVAVVSLGNSSEEAWPLARAVYGRPKLRPAHLSEAEVRILAGDPVEKDASPPLQQLAADRANLGGDPSTTALVSLGSSLHVSALYLVVSVPSKVAGVKAKARARLFSVSSRSFVGDWKTPTSIFGKADADPWADAAKTAELSLSEKTDAKPFYASPWFWGALGAAAALGTTAIVIASAKTTDTLSLRGEVLR